MLTSSKAKSRPGIEFVFSHPRLHTCVVVIWHHQWQINLTYQRDILRSTPHSVYHSDIMHSHKRIDVTAQNITIQRVAKQPNGSRTYLMTSPDTSFIPPPLISPLPIESLPWRQEILFTHTRDQCAFQNIAPASSFTHKKRFHNIFRALLMLKWSEGS